MSCRRTRRNLSPFLDGVLPPGEARKVQAHLERCEACARQHRSLAETVSLLRSAPGARPPRWLGEVILETEASRVRRPWLSDLASGLLPGQAPWLRAGIFGSLSAVLLTVLLLTRLAPGYDFLLSGGAPLEAPSIRMFEDFTAIPGVCSQGAARPDTALVLADVEVVSFGLPAGEGGAGKGAQDRAPAAPSAPQTNLFDKGLARAVADMDRVNEINRAIAEANRQIELENRRIHRNNETIRRFNQYVREENQVAESDGTGLRKALVPLFLYITKHAYAEAAL